MSVQREQCDPVIAAGIGSTAAADSPQPLESGVGASAVRGATSTPSGRVDSAAADDSPFNKDFTASLSTLPDEVLLEIINAIGDEAHRRANVDPADPAAATDAATAATNPIECISDEALLQATAAVRHEASIRAARGGRARTPRTSGTTPPLRGPQRGAGLAMRPSSRPTSRPTSSGPSPAASPQQQQRRSGPSPPSPLWGAMRGLLPPALAEWADADWSPFSSRFSSSPSPACSPITPAPKGERTRTTSSHQARADAPMHASLPPHAAGEQVPGCSPAQVRHDPPASARAQRPGSQALGKARRASGGGGGGG
eukprot:CAMPEP_0118822688 /NCGR_PEP_ID=MMETSP1162-20130426/9369_1 /TAXON_ID=33656 /ORGANISM="Phaeocystis Sp, Strain CCMP2710" /LENGTH=312 /DNA_ID=CAMNT_0006753259 /DNA_START=41 /DNA_END=975 /DNA_ORIENTATION=-